MKKGSTRILFHVCLILLALVLGTAVAYAAPQDVKAAKPTLTSDDCIKCHAKPPADVAAAGGKHKMVACQSCHAGGHPPTVSGKSIIPKCSNCHTGKPHFELKDCLGCHTNPHTPRNIKIGTNVTDPCVSCHTKQIKQLKEVKTKHSMLYCSTCHSTKHPNVPECLKCHKPHSADMLAADCKKCHMAHAPKPVTYEDVPAKFCAGCHKTAFDLLTASKAKHKDFACAFCHQAKHKMIPRCQDCHGDKHPAGMMAKFNKCGDCHGIAHDINNFSKQPNKEEPKKAAAPHKAGKKK
ncbi:MAG: cytochrome C [Thermodesulfovibrionales bacterium]